MRALYSNCKYKCKSEKDRKRGRAGEIKERDWGGGSKVWHYVSCYEVGGPGPGLLEAGHRFCRRSSFILGIATVQTTQPDNDVRCFEVFKKPFGLV